MFRQVDEILGDADGSASGFPPNNVQERFVGRSGRSALQEVVPFLALISDFYAINNNVSIVDFGAGWGRIARFFQGVVPSERLYLADVDPEALGWCEACGVKGTRILLDKAGNFPLPDAAVDIVYAYSVFSHLSEASAVHWLNDLHRVLKKNGLLVFTTQSLRFLHLVSACAAKPNANDLERSIGQYMGSNPQKSILAYESGKHTYSDVNGNGGGGVLTGDFYGWAAIPPVWFDREFASKFAIEKYVDDPAVLEQAVYVVRKR